MKKRFLVCILAFIANAINTRFGGEFESIYNRNDAIGKMAKKCLYDPSERQSAVIRQQTGFQTTSHLRRSCGLL